jgi:proteasome lid subunit RPN8/RPN11
MSDDDERGHDQEVCGIIRGWKCGASIKNQEEEEHQESVAEDHPIEANKDSDTAEGGFFLLGHDIATIFHA